MSGSFTSVRDALTNLQVGYRGMHFCHGARTSIAEHCIVLELGPHLVDGPLGSCGLHGVPHRAQVRWILCNRTQYAARVNARRFSACTDQRVMRTDHDMMWCNGGIGDRVHDDLLEPPPDDLFHDVLD
jgi:hypothetical protein